MIRPNLLRLAAGLCLLFSVGLMLRLWGICHDLPDVYHMDVDRLIDNARRFHEQGHMTPHDWDKPTAHMHFYALGMSAWLAVRNAGMAAAAWIGHSFVNTAFGAYAGQPPISEFEAHLLSRLLSALMGALIPLLMLAAGGLAFGRATGWIAAWMACLCPDLAVFAHTENAYTPLTFVALVSFTLALAAWKMARPALLLASSAALGVAAQVQFNALPLALPLLAVSVPLGLTAGPDPARRRWARWIGLLAGMGVCMAAGMAVSDPYTLVNPTGFVSGVLDKFFTYTKPFERQWSYEQPMPRVILGMLAPGLGFPFWALTLAGLAMSCARYPGTSLLLALFPACYLLWMSFMTVMFPRYLLIILPHLLLWAALAARMLADGAARFLPAPRAVRMLVLAGLMAPAAWTAVENGRFFAIEDTRNSAQEWLMANVPPGTRIFTEKYAPPIPENHFWHSRIFSLSDCSIADFRRLQTRYLVTCDYQSRRYTLKHSPEHVLRYQALERELRPVARFRLKNLMSFYHPDIRIYEIPPVPGMRPEPVGAPLPNVPMEADDPNYHVLYSDNPVLGPDPDAMALASRETTVCFLPAGKNPLRLTVLTCADDGAPVRLALSLDATRDKISAAPADGALRAYTLAPRWTPPTGLHRIDLRLQRGASAFVRLITDEFEAGRTALDFGLPDQARDCFQRCLERTPGHPVARLYLARALLARNRAEEALDALEQAGLADSPAGALLAPGTEEAWDRQFAVAFGALASDLRTLRTLHLVPDMEHCIDARRIRIDPATRNVLCNPEPGKTGEPTPVFEFRNLRLNRGWYRLEMDVKDAAGSPSAAGGRVRMDSPRTSGASEAAFEAGFSGPVSLRVYSEGYRQAWRLSVHSFNRRDFTVSGVRLVPLLRESMSAEMLRILLPLREAARKDGRQALGLQLDSLLESAQNSVANPAKIADTEIFVTPQGHSTRERPAPALQKQ